MTKRLFFIEDVDIGKDAVVFVDFLDIEFKVYKFILSNKFF